MQFYIFFMRKISQHKVLLLMLLAAVLALGCVVWVAFSFFGTADAAPLELQQTVLNVQGTSQWFLDYGLDKVYPQQQTIAFRGN